MKITNLKPKHLIVKSILPCLIMLFLSQNNCNAQAEVALAGQTVNGIVDNFADRIDDIIANLDNVITKQSFDIRSHLQLVLQQADYIVGKNIDKTFEKLTKEQQDLLTDINNTISQVEQTGQILIQDVDQILNKGVALIGTLPGSKKAPVLTGLSPTYYGNSENQDVSVRIDGAWLAHKEPYILIDGEEYKPTTKIDSRLEFLLPLDLYNDSTRINLKTAELIVFKKRLFGSKEQKYTLGFYLVPEMMGTFKLLIKTNEVDSLYNYRAEKFGHRNRHCQNSRGKTWVFNSAGPKWKIDVNSVELSGVHVSRNSTRPNIENKTANGFRVSGEVRNYGSCRRILGEYVYRDARGSVNGTVEWKEFRTIDTLSELNEIASGTLYWNTEYGIDLGPNLNSFRLEILQLNGETKIIDENEVEKWFTVKFNRTTNFLQIEPNSLSTALY
ncbi:hypothetical protein [Reichenbachiella ulvae]|uniref:Uncharacterized protein n=1 Tax=Reichenbachiella ulvae TaxID=2980104 RepID=A0ABT3CWI8_9BACT|nr:hypothetical protein [Reichenbachiella ulvae]MCV9388076.1 hypothetical protein [Reichenbachiella ulvae]